MTEWTDFYDNALHPDKSDPRDHDDIHPVAWRERIADQRRVSSGDAPPQRWCGYPWCDCDGPEGPACGLPGYAEAMTRPIIEGDNDVTH